MNNEKLNSTPKLSIAKREIFRICKDPVYFFCTSFVCWWLPLSVWSFFFR